MRRRDHGARSVCVEEQRYKSWCSENDDGMREVRISVNEKLHEKVVEVYRKSDIEMALMFVFEVEVVRVKCACELLVVKVDCKKDQFLKP